VRGRVRWCLTCLGEPKNPPCRACNGTGVSSPAREAADVARGEGRHLGGDDAHTPGPSSGSPLKLRPARRTR